jgi:hypothetical protein
MDRASGWGRTLVLIGVLVLAAGALVIVPPLLVEEAPPPATAGPSTVPFSASPSPQPPPSFAVSPYRSIEWRLAAFPDPAFEPGAITSTGERLVSAGVTDREVAAWYSDDAVRWERASIPPLPAVEADRQPWLNGLAATSERLLVTGVWVDEAGSGGPFAYISTDHGMTWAAGGLPGGNGDLEILSLTATDDRFVAITYEPASDTGASWWTSADGSEWERLTADGLPTGRLRMALAGNPGGLVAAGNDGERPQPHPAAWFSTDGDEWIPTVYGVEQVGGILLARAASPGFLLAGQVGGTPVVWMSPDGRRWSSIVFPELRQRQVGAAALGQAGALLVIERLTSGEDVPASTRVRFLRAGTTDTTDAELPLVSLVPAALGDRFIVLGQCPGSGQLDCEGTSIAIGTLVR